MKYIYTALLLHKLGKPITVDNIANVVRPFVEPDMNQITMLVECLKGVDIEQALRQTIVPETPPTKKAQTDQQPKEPDKEDSFKGLGDLFGGL